MLGLTMRILTRNSRLKGGCSRAVRLQTSNFLSSSPGHDASFLHGISVVEEDNILPKTSLVWLDMEMTGLDIDKETIMEIACIITDKDLNVIVEAEDLILKVDDDYLKNMDEWCQMQHGNSGLTEACRRSELSLAQAEEKLLSFLQQHVPKNGCPLAGNTVHHDKLFLDRYMPRVTDHLHYRIIDVTSLSELVKRWFPEEHEATPRKMNVHRAKGDIIESIQQLRYLRQAVFK